MVQGYHGTGKSTQSSRWLLVELAVHPDQFGFACERMDLVGKDAIVLKDGQQITEFKEGLLPWALQRAAIVFDEYDAGRPDVMFVIQRVLEVEGKLTLLDQSRVISPHQSFRMFATTNTIGLGDPTGLITEPSRSTKVKWIAGISSPLLNYLPHESEVNIVSAKHPGMDQRRCLIWCRLRTHAARVYQR